MCGYLMKIIWWSGSVFLPLKRHELQVSFEQLVNEIDHNYEYSQSTEEPHGSPEQNNNYDCKNQQNKVLNTSLNSHVLIYCHHPIKPFRQKIATHAPQSISSSSLTFTKDDNYKR